MRELLTRMKRRGYKFMLPFVYSFELAGCFWTWIETPTMESWIVWRAASYLTVCPSRFRRLNTTISNHQHLYSKNTAPPKAPGLWPQLSVMVWQPPHSWKSKCGHRRGACGMEVSITSCGTTHGDKSNSVSDSQGKWANAYRIDGAFSLVYSLQQCCLVNLNWNMGISTEGDTDVACLFSGSSISSLLTQFPICFHYWVKK